MAEGTISLLPLIQQNREVIKLTFWHLRMRSNKHEGLQAHWNGKDWLQELFGAASGGDAKQNIDFTFTFASHQMRFQGPPAK